MFHAYRIVAMRGMLDHGWIFSRWVPNLALGYGYPFFNYREPLPYWVGEVGYLAGLPLSLVLGLIYSASLVGAAWGAYVLGRDLFGEHAGWVAGVAYGLGPYVLLDPLRRGNMPESVALALLPWLFVAIRRVIIGRRHGAALATLVLLVALFLTHNISSLLVAPFLGLYVVLLTLLYRDRGGWTTAFLVVGAAVLLTSWFWLPALGERGMVQLDLSRATRNNDFHYNFVTWREMLFTLPVPHDPDFLNPPMRVAVGMGQLALGIVGAVAGLRGGVSRQQRSLTLLMIAAAGVYLWMATPGSVAVWEGVSLLSFVQFPWRLVGRALLPISLLAGQATSLWSTPDIGSGQGRGRPRPAWLSALATLAVVVVLTLLAWPDTYPPKGMCSAGRYPTLEDLYAREQDGWLGMDPESSYFPVWVETHPSDTSLASQFAAGYLPERMDMDSLPSGAAVVRSEYRPLSSAVAIDTPVGFTARWLGLYFPGWRAQIDGADVPVAPEDDTGLITFGVPAGEHLVTVYFGLTPVRKLGAALSLLGVALTVGGALWRTQRRQRSAAPGSSPVQASPTTAIGAQPGIRGGAGLLVTLLAVAAGLALVRLTVVGTVASPVQRSRMANGGLPEVSQALDVSFSGGLNLVGMTFDVGTMAADGELPVDLLWAAETTPDADYLTTVLLRDADGRTWSPAGTERPRGYEQPVPTTAWQPGDYAYDPHLVTALPGTPPGTYDVVVAAFDARTLSPASALDGTGQPLGPDLVVGSIEVTPPSRTASLAALGVPNDATLTHCGKIGLWSMSLDRRVGVPGDVVAITWVWEALGTPAKDLAAIATIEDSDGSVARSWTLPLVSDSWPTDRWRLGDRWTGRHIVRLPGGLASGTYKLVMRITGCDGVLGEVSIDVRAPERAWTVPARFSPLAIEFGDSIELAGIVGPPAAVAAGDAVDIELAWSALDEIDAPYHVFVHLLDGAGNLVAQSDGEPANWTRPTTGWAAREVVTEERTLAVPEGTLPGTYVLRVGLYLPGGSRLNTPEGADGVVIATITVR